MRSVFEGSVAAGALTARLDGGIGFQYAEEVRGNR